MTLTLVPPMAVRANPRRREALHLMMARYEDAKTMFADGGGSGGKPGSRVLHFDLETWTPEYRELERCLDLLRAAAKQGRHATVILPNGDHAWCQSLYWNLAERYLRAQVMRRSLRTEKTKRGRRIVGVPANAEIVAGGAHIGGRADVLLRVWDARVQPERVDAALDWVSERYRGEPGLPQGLVA